MPTIRVEMFSGRTHEQKRALVKGITQAVTEALGVTPDAVGIQIQEFEKHNSARAGVLHSELEQG